jgi:hypothetical protein
VSAIALAGLRSFLRAPESKLMLLTPLIFAVAFGSMVLRSPQTIPHAVRPLIGTAAMLMVLMGMFQIMANQFGFDRDGFCVFVLCAVPRRDILLGKNLAFAPLAIGLASLLMVVVQVFCPLRLDHLAAILPQFVSMFLSFSLLANLTSIFAPIAIAAGSLKPANQKLVPVLLQMVMIFFLFPLSQAPMLLPLVIEYAVSLLEWSVPMPVALLLTIVECAVVVFIYRRCLDWEGRLFQSREQRILEEVTNRVP